MVKAERYEGPESDRKFVSWPESEAAKLKALFADDKRADDAMREALTESRDL